MKKILIITGYSGAGKSTVAKEFLRFAQDDSPALLTFGEVGKRLAVKNGFERLGEYFENTETVVFKEKLRRALLAEIDHKIQNTDFLVVEGLVYYDVVLAVKDTYKKVLLVKIDVPYEIRVQRIAEKLEKTIQEAQENEKRKAKLKYTIGIDKVMECADYRIDGRKPVEEVAAELVRLVECNWR